MTRTASDKRGIALAVALFALVVMGALVAGHFFAGRLEQQSGRNTLFAGQAAEAAEAGLVETLGTISASTLVTLPIGGAALSLGTTALSPGFRVDRQVSRLTSTLFLIRAHGVRHDAAGHPLAARALGWLVKLAADPQAGSPTVVPLRERGWVQLY
jgi:hypothetical protein